MPLAFINHLLLFQAVYWMTEALPIAVTSLIPMVNLFFGIILNLIIWFIYLIFLNFQVLFPVLGVCSTNEVGVNYLKSTNFMFIGGLILALAVEQSGLHQRIALRILLLIGTSPRNLLLGFMLTTGKLFCHLKVGLFSPWGQFRERVLHKHEFCGVSKI